MNEPDAFAPADTEAARLVRAAHAATEQEPWSAELAEARVLLDRALTLITTAAERG